MAYIDLATGIEFTGQGASALREASGFEESEFVRTAGDLAVNSTIQERTHVPLHLEVKSGHAPISPWDDAAQRLVEYSTRS